MALLLACSSSKNHLFLDYTFEPVNPVLALGANSTVLYSDTILEIQSPSKARYTVQKAVTIFDKDDKDLSVLVLDYNEEFISIDYLIANVRDEQGKLIRSYKLEDAQDYSTSWGSTFFSDTRLKVLEMPYSQFPYTIEYEYQKSYKGLLNLPDWNPQSLGQSVKYSSFKLIDKGKTGVRYFNKNLESAPKQESNIDYPIYKWSLTNLLPVQREDYGPPSAELLPRVEVAPGSFVMEESKGNASTWKEFGKWYYNLGKETRELPKGAKDEVNRLISGITSEKEKVKILFDHLQDRSRYVSIQLGIGGWKPFSAKYVYENSYGDCKALTNYMHAMLEYAGIKAESVLIYRGVNDFFMNIDFPGNQFNHVILRVTLENGEVVWLECTSKYLPPNHIGPDNEDKFALLVTEEGGEVIQTPSYTYSTNKSNSWLRVTIDEQGETLLDYKTEEEGILQDYTLRAILPVSEKEREEWVSGLINTDNSQIVDYDFSSLNTSDEYASYNFRAKLGNYTQTSGKRIFFPVNKINRFFFQLKEDDSRDHPLYLPYTFSESDSIIFETPAEFEIESTPRNFILKEDFGEFKSTFENLGNGKMIYHRALSIKEKVIEPEYYEKLKKFFDEVRRSDQQQVVLVRE